MEFQVSKKRRTKLIKFLMAMTVCSSILISGCAKNPIMNKLHVKNSSTIQSTSFVRTTAPAIKSSSQVSTNHFYQFKMFGDSNGFAVTDKKVYRKTASKWVDITPSKLNQVHIESLNLYAVNSSFAIVSMKDMIFKTKDGGKSWQTLFIPGAKDVNKKASSADFSFISSKTGWMLVHRGYATGHSPFDIYKTTNQGSSWKLVDHVGYGSKSVHNIPDTKDPKKITFLDDKRGFITGKGNDPQEIIFYKTIDGGKSWTQLFLPLPKSFGNTFFEFKAPQFFSANEGIMQLHIEGNGKKYTSLYTTFDQGAHWKQAYGWDGEMEITFLNRMLGWANAKKQPNHPNAAIIFQTKTGGQTWNSVTSLKDNLLEIQFISKDKGWGVSEKNHQLMETKNGGGSWGISTK